MDNTSPNSQHFFRKACIFESSLILLALGLAWIAGIDPFAYLYFTESDFALAVLATGPLYGLFLVLERMTLESVSAIRQLLFDTLGANLQACHWADLMVLAAIAGISEEVLFRGVIQPWLEATWGAIVGLVASNIIFGLVHAVTPLYALLAGLIGIYLGLSMDYAGDRNLLIPIIIHGLYDFLVFIALLKAYRASRAG